jgi:hypothetical protein
MMAPMPSNPGVEDFSNGLIELLDALPNGWRLSAGQHQRQIFGL